MLGAKELPTNTVAIHKHATTRLILATCDDVVYY